MFSFANMSMRTICWCCALLFVLVLTGLGLFWSWSKKTGYTTKLEGFEHVSKPTLIFFRANWCGYCKQFKPTWDEFVEKANYEDLTSKVDIVELDVDQPESATMKERCGVTGFPTVTFVKDDQDKGVKYNGARTVEGLLEFIHARV